jgi:cytochrome c
VDGWYQGAAFRFSQGLEAGVNRLTWGPDGSLYVGMTGYRGNWTWRETTYGLQKLMPTGEAPFEMLGISARPDGFVIEFTHPADRDFLADPVNYGLSTWRYESTPQYGGPELDLHQLRVESAEVAEDGRSVRIRVPGLKPGYVVYFRLDPLSAEGEKMWTTQAWYTLNRIPGSESGQ